jgi:hypothetical protein
MFGVPVTELSKSFVGNAKPENCFTRPNVECTEALASPDGIVRRALTTAKRVPLHMVDRLSDVSAV